MACAVAPLVHTDFTSSGEVKKRQALPIVVRSSTAMERSIEQGYSVKMRPYRFTMYRGAVAAVMPNTKNESRRLASPFEQHEIFDLNEQLRVACNGMEWSPTCNPSVRSVLKVRLSFAQSRAISRDRSFSLTIEDLCQLYDKQEGLCAVTGLMLDTGSDPNASYKWRKPFRVSLDRIDSDKGYDPENVRLVCAAVNNAMGAWGEGVFAILAAAFLCNRRSRSSAVERRVHIADVTGSIPVATTTA